MASNLQKCFGLISVTALTSLVLVGAAGCGDTVTYLQTAAGDAGSGTTQDGKGKSTDTDPTDPATPSKPSKPTTPDPEPEDAGVKDSGTPTKDSGLPPPPPPPPPPTGCLDATPINATLIPYKKAGVTAGACTTNDLTTLSTYYKTKTDNGETVLASQWAASVSATCAKCVFSDGNGTTWTPILTANNELANVDRGGCIEVKSGKESCGRAYQQATECRLNACSTLCQTQQEFTDCLADTNAIFNGPCAGALTKLDLECGASLPTWETACQGTTWTFEGPIKAQCITGN